MSNWVYQNFACSDEPDGSIRIVKYGGSDPIVFIPTLIENRPVKIIGQYAFVNNEDIEEVILPLQLEIIEEFAFSYCYSLKRIVIPKSVRTIGKRAFSRCKSLNDIRMPSIIDIGRGAFTTVPGIPDKTSRTDSMINDRIEELGLSVPDKAETITEGDYPVTFSTQGRELKIETTTKIEEGQRIGLRWNPDDIHVMRKMG